MVGYGQLLASVVGFFVIAVVGILTAIALPNLKRNPDFGSSVFTITVFLLIIAFHCLCIYIGQKAIQDERKRNTKKINKQK